jgi:hypothetical protein
MRAEPRLLRQLGHRRVEGRSAQVGRRDVQLGQVERARVGHLARQRVRRRHQLGQAVLEVASQVGQVGHRVGVGEQPVGDLPVVADDGDREGVLGCQEGERRQLLELVPSR